MKKCDLCGRMHADGHIFEEFFRMEDDEPVLIFGCEDCTEDFRQGVRDSIAEKITQRRRQVWVHSVIYYRMDHSIISDSQWSKWAQELEDLQRDFPEIAAKCPHSDIFEDFDHSTGSNLPLDDPWVVNKARQLLRMRGLA